MKNNLTGGSRVALLVVPLICATVAVTLAALAAMASGPAAPGTNAPATRVFEFTYKAEIPQAPAGTKSLKIWLPYPKSDENQEIFDVQVSAPPGATVYTEPRFGDSALYVAVDDPSGPIAVTLKYKVRRQEYLRKDFARVKQVVAGPLDPSVEEYLKADRLVPIDGKIKELSVEVTKGKKTDLEKARAIYDYTLANMKYDKSGEGWGRGDIFFACDAKRGNCTDFHALFIGLSRAAGIPARFSIGFPLPEKRGEAEISGYHCWAEFYLKGYGWVPVDCSEAWKHPEKRDYFFGGHDENRVQLSTGRDLILRPRQQSGPLNYFIYPHVEADGKSIDETIKKTFHFKDLEGDEAAKAL
jgi:transglutaminase-like putative cysteine protease